MSEGGKLKTVTQAGKTVREHLPPIGFFVAAFAFWEVLVRVTGVSEFLLPAPSTIFSVMLNMQRAYYVPWIHHIRLTLFEIIAGFLLAVAVGILLAVFITYSTTMEKTLMPVIVFVEVLPKIAVAPLFLIWIGYGMEPKIAIAFLIAFFPMVVNTATGLRDVDPDLIDLLRILKASKMQVFAKVRFPSAIPHIMSGLKISMTSAVIGAIVGEFVASSEGLGYLIVNAQSTLQTPMAFASLFYIAILGLILFGAVSLMGRFFKY